jgi:hypothetical protein
MNFKKIFLISALALIPGITFAGGAAANGNLSDMLDRARQASFSTENPAYNGVQELINRRDTNNFWLRRRPNVRRDYTNFDAARSYFGQVSPYENGYQWEGYLSETERKDGTASDLSREQLRQLKAKDKLLRLRGIYYSN